MKNIYIVKIKNTMFGYERDQTVQISAETKEQALKEAQQIDVYADVSIDALIPDTQSKEYTEWMAGVWKQNLEKNKKLENEICIAEINSGIYSDE